MKSFARAPFVTGSRLALVCAALALAGRPAAAEDPTRFAADRPLDCLHIKLDLDVDLEAKHVEGTARIDLVALREVMTITLDAVDLETRSVTLARGSRRPAPARYTNDGKLL